MKGRRGPIILELRVHVPKYPGLASEWKHKTLAGKISRLLSLTSNSLTKSSFPLISTSESWDINSRTELLWYILDRKSTRLNSSHTVISYAVFCLKKKNVLIYG